jgi:hypothetical protein
MQIEVSDSSVQVLEAQAASLDISVGEYASRLLSRFAEATQHPENFRLQTHEDARAWMLSQNPNLPEHSPEIDWQALKAEARR